MWGHGGEGGALAGYVPCVMRGLAVPLNAGHTTLTDVEHVLPTLHVPPHVPPPPFLWRLHPLGEAEWAAKGPDNRGARVFRPMCPPLHAGVGCIGRGRAGGSERKATEGPACATPCAPCVPPGFMQVSAALGEAERAAASAKQQRGLREAEVAAARAASSSGGTPSTGTAPSRTVRGAVQLRAVVGSMP